MLFCMPECWAIPSLCPNLPQIFDNMRLSSIQAQIIRQTVAAVLGQEAKIVLFGSRVDDSERGVMWIC